MVRAAIRIAALLAQTSLPKAESSEREGPLVSDVASSFWPTV